MRYKAALMVAGGLVAASAIVGSSWHARSGSRSGAEAIAPDPDAQTQPVALKELEAPAVASPIMRETPSRRRSLSNQPALPPTPPLDTIEPWTGEDLAPQLQLAAAERPRLQVDRRDPWDLGTIHPYNPNPDPAFDNSDPWASNAPATGVAKATPPEPPVNSPL